MTRNKLIYAIVVVSILASRNASAHRRDVETAKTFFTKPAGCSTNQFAYDIAKAGTLSCSTVSPAGLNTSNSPSNGQCLTYKSATTNFEWAACGTGGGSGDVTDVGPGCSGGACLTNGTVTTGSTMFVWEGTSNDANDFTINAPSANPTTSRTITFPDETGTICTNGSICTGYQAGPLTGDVTTSSTTATLNTVSPNKGGTGVTSYGSAGAILYAPGPTPSALAVLATPAQTSRYLSGGSAPSWSTVDLVGGVSGTLAVGNGGTGKASYGASGEILYSGSTSTVTSLPTPVATSRYLVGGSTPSWTTIDLVGGVNGNLGAGNGGTGKSTYGAGEILYAATSNPSALTALPTPAATARYLTGGTSGGAAPSWSQVSLTSGVTGTLPTTNGGTGRTNGSVGLADLADALNRVPTTCTSGKWANGITSNGDASCVNKDPAYSFIYGDTGSMLSASVYNSDFTVSGTSPLSVNGNSGSNTLTISLASAVRATQGGTGVSSFGSAGAILYAPHPSPSALAVLPTPAATSRYLTGGSVPSWSTIDLVGGVSGTLALENLYDDPTSGKCLISGGSGVGQNPTWGSCSTGGGITGISDGSSATTGSTVTLSGGSGITTTRSTDTITIATASTEQNFLATGTLSCGASTAGQMVVSSTTPLQYCDGTATPALKYAAYGSSTGVASTADAGDTATGFFPSGTIEVARGGTDLSSYTAGNILYATGSTTLAGLPTPSPTSSPRYLKAVSGSTLSWDVIELDKGVTGTLAAANGGTGSTLVEFSGATSSKKTYTLPNASVTLTAVTGDNSANGSTDATIGTSAKAVAPQVSSSSVYNGALVIGSVEATSIGASRKWTCCIYSGATATTSATIGCAVEQIGTGSGSPQILVASFVEKNVSGTRYYDYKCSTDAGSANSVTNGRISFIVF